MALVRMRNDFAEYNYVVANKHHTGLDVVINVAAGQDVVAAADGEIVLIQHNDVAGCKTSGGCEDHGYGTTIIVKHATAASGIVYTQYSHLSDIAAGLLDSCKPGLSPPPPDTGKRNRYTCTERTVDGQLRSGPAVTAGQSLGSTGATCYGTSGATCGGHHLHFELKDFGTLGSRGHDNGEFGYSVNHPEIATASNHWLDPAKNLHPTTAVSPPRAAQVVQDVTAYVGPSTEYRYIRNLTAGEAVRVVARSDEFGVGGCARSWVQVERTDGSYFQDTNGRTGTIPDAWVCGVAIDLDLDFTSTTLTVAPAPINWGQSVALTANVNATTGTQIPTGTVTFMSGVNTLGVVQIQSNGRASLSVPDLAAGTHRIRALYSGSTEHAPSEAISFSLRVNPIGDLKLAVAPNPAEAGKTFIARAKIVDTSGAVVTSASGHVVFKVGAEPEVSIALDQGIATLTKTITNPGTYRIVAKYAGVAVTRFRDVEVTPSTSAATRTILRSNLNPSVVGQMVSLRATVTSIAGGQTPTGSVVFRKDGTDVASAPLTNGRAVYATTTLPIGTHTITAHYQPDTGFQASNSAPLAQVVGDGKIGEPFRVDDGNKNIYRPRVARLADGGFVVVWTAVDEANGTSFGWARRYTASGIPASPPFRVNEATSYWIEEIDVAGLTSGGFVVVWSSYDQDGSGYGIRMRRHDAAGIPQGEEETVNSTAAGHQYHPAIAGLAGDWFVVVWTSVGQAETQSSIYSQRFNASGSRAGGEERVDPGWQDARDASVSPAVTHRSGGGYAVTWSTYVYAPDDVATFVRLFRANGEPVGYEGYGYTGARSAIGSIAPGTGGGVNVITLWDHNSAGSHIKIHRISATGTTIDVGTVNYASPGSKPGITLTSLGSRRAIWKDVMYDPQTGTNRVGVFGQRLGSGALPIGDPFRISPGGSAAPIDHDSPGIAPHGDGGFVAIWTAIDQSSARRGIFAQRYGP